MLITLHKKRGKSAPHERYFWFDGEKKIVSWSKKPKDAGSTASLDLLPNRNMSLWAYTELNDPRFNWCEDRLEITQDANKPSTKLGFLHQMQTAHYEVDGYKFSKTIDYRQDATYPDGNCNLEIFTDGTMLELESLGPLVTLNKGERIVHTENWSLNPL